MPPKKKQRLLSKREQEKARQDFLEKIANDEETPFNKEVSFEALDQSLKYFLWLTYFMTGMGFEPTNTQILNYLFNHLVKSYQFA